MEPQFLDHGNIEALRQLFKGKSRLDITKLTVLIIENEKIKKFPPIATMTVFRNLKELVVRNCKLKEFPADVFVKVSPLVEIVDLENNKMNTVEHVLPLGELQYLTDLNLLGNPMRLLQYRVSLIQALLYPESKIRLKLLACLCAEYSANSPKVVYQKSSPAKYTMSQLIMGRQRPAKVPRQGTFPMLIRLNKEVITDSQIKSAKPYVDEKLIAKNEKFTYDDPKLESVRRRNKRILAKKRRNEMYLKEESLHPCGNKKTGVVSVPNIPKRLQRLEESDEQDAPSSDHSLYVPAQEEEEIKDPEITIEQKNGKPEKSKHTVKKRGIQTKGRFLSVGQHRRRGHPSQGSGLSPTESEKQEELKAKKEKVRMEIRERIDELIAKLKLKQDQTPPIIQRKSSSLKPLHSTPEPIQNPQLEIDKYDLLLTDLNTIKSERFSRRKTPRPGLEQITKTLEFHQLAFDRHFQILQSHKAKIFSVKSASKSERRIWQNEYLEPHKTLLPNIKEPVYEIKVPNNKKAATIYRMAEQRIRKEEFQRYEIPEFLNESELNESRLAPKFEEVLQSSDRTIVLLKRLESSLELYFSRFKEREKEFEELFSSGHVIMRLKEIRRSIADREQYKERVEKLLRSEENILEYIRQNDRIV